MPNFSIILLANMFIFSWLTLTSCSVIDGSSIKDRKRSDANTETDPETVPDPETDPGTEVEPEAINPDDYTCDLTDAVWETSESFQFTSGKASVGVGLAVDANGTLYYGGRGQGADGKFNFFVRKTSDEGKTWEAVDDFQHVAGQDSQAFAFGNDPKGNLFMLGSAVDGAGSEHWMVRSSTDGATWTSDDPFQNVAGKAARALSFTANSDGVLYMTGWSIDATDTKKWIYRKSSSGGASWATAPTSFELTADSISEGRSFYAAPNNTIIIAGQNTKSDAGAAGTWVIYQSTNKGVDYALKEDFQFRTDKPSSVNDFVSFTYDAGTATEEIALYALGQGQEDDLATGASDHWLIRKSVDGGTTWAVDEVDDFQAAFGKDSVGMKIIADDIGVLYAVGYGKGTDDTDSIVVRTSSDRGVTWTTSDTFQVAAGKNTKGYDIKIDSRGNVYAVGEADANAIVRKLPCTYVKK